MIRGIDIGTDAQLATSLVSSRLSTHTCTPSLCTWFFHHARSHGSP